MSRSICPVLQDCTAAVVGRDINNIMGMALIGMSGIAMYVCIYVVSKEIMSLVITLLLHRLNQQ